MSKINCWEFRKCGRAPGGYRAKEFGVCPATTETRMNGIHGGTNGGRSCWAVAGTFCFGEVQGTFANEFKNCMDCEFFWLIHGEEEDFVPSVGTLHIGMRKS